MHVSQGTTNLFNLLEDKNKQILLKWENKYILERRKHTIEVAAITKKKCFVKLYFLVIKKYFPEYQFYTSVFMNVYWYYMYIIKLYLCKFINIVCILYMGIDIIKILYMCIFMYRFYLYCVLLLPLRLTLNIFL